MSHKNLITDQSYDHVKYVEYRGIDEYLRKLLEEVYMIREEDIEDVFSPNQLSKFEIRDDYLYFAVQLPAERNHEISIQQIHCFVNKKYFFVVDENGLGSLKTFNNTRDQRIIEEKYTSFDLFYELLDISIVNIFPLVTSIHHKIRNVEKTIFTTHSLAHDKILEIQNIKKYLINIKSVLAPLEEILKDISTKHIMLIDSISQEAIDDSLDKIKKLLNRLENAREIMKLLTESNEMFIARSTDQTIRRLTLINIFLLGPTLVAGFFGMNVYFGWFSDGTSSELPLLVIVVLMLFLTLSMYYFFRMKKWI